MNSKIHKRNLRRTLEELQLKNTSLKTAKVLWIVLTIITLVTIILPIIFFGFYRRYKKQEQNNTTQIRNIAAEMESLAGEEKNIE
ncbi:hypothetical protein J4410_01245 [Candidatus Woesearchaeota archaeon]|nr:hypothetical protein [Candidatus Woesearchaeota archaeon]